MSSDPLAVVTGFGDACNAHDLGRALSFCAEEMVLDSTTPPDGDRIIGHDALRALWEPIFADPATKLEVEETIVTADRVIQRCRYSWGGGHVRAVDVYTIRDGKIVEKLSYVKG